MKKIFLGFLILLTVFVFISGCGQSAGGGSTTPTTTTTTTTSGGGANVTITGSVYSGTVNSSALRSSSVNALASPSSALASQKVVAVGATTGNLYFASDTDSSGNFTLIVPSTENFSLVMLNANNQLSAPIIMNTGTSSGYCVTGLDPSSNSSIDLGQIVYESSKSSAVLAQAKTTYEASNIVARTKSGETLVPAGAGNFGKGTDAKLPSGGTTAEGVDEDKDGLPNLFDADLDGNGIINQIDGNSAPNPTGNSTYVNNIGLFMNLKIGFENTATYTSTYTDFILTLEMVPKTGQHSNISSVEVIEAPGAYKNTATVSDGGSGWTWIDTYPSNNPLWSSTGFKLYKVDLGGSDYRWTVFVQPGSGKTPGTDILAGDIFKFRVYYTDGTYEDFVKMIDYVFSEIPMLNTYNGTTITNNNYTNGPGTMNNPFAFSGASTVTIEVMRPKDEAGNYLTGLSYSVGITTGNITTEPTLMSWTDSLTPADSSAAMLATLEVTGIATTTAFKADITASCGGGDNAATMPYFQKQ